MCTWVGSANAAVLLNEIAWMGTTESYLCEWIELYNSGDTAVSVADWSLQINDGPIKPFADGTFSTTNIAAGGYLVIERAVASCPDPVSATNDALLAFGSIPNTDTTIQLYRDIDGTDLADRIASGEDWTEVGGDNETKETAQYSSVGWQTAPATPGRANVTSAANGSEQAQSDSESNPSSDTSPKPRVAGVRSSEGSSKTTISLAEASAQQEPLVVDIEYPTTVYVGQPVTFTAEPAGRSKTVRDSLHYYWNFGDLTTAAGPTANHQYQFPGEYMVSLQAEYYEYEASDTRKVVVLPVTLRMNITSDGHLNIHNTAQYEVDVSGYTLSTVPSVTFPPRSMLVPRGTVTVPNAKLGTHAAAIVLHDQAGNLVSDTEGLATETEIDNHQAPATSQQSVATITPQPLVQVPHSVVTEGTAPVTGPSLAMVTRAQLAQAQSAVPDTVPDDTRTVLWYALLAGLMVVGVVTIFFTVSPNAASVRE